MSFIKLSQAAHIKQQLALVGVNSIIKIQQGLFSVIMVNGAK